MKIKVGFTGSRDGMTKEQLASVRELMRVLRPKEAHHGDCVGADAYFHAVCLDEYIPLIVIHPPDKDGLREFCGKGPLAKSTLVLRNPLPYLDRNKNIVNACQLLIACPKEVEEQQRSGTWSTVRYAKKQGVDINVIQPDGTIVLANS